MALTRKERTLGCLWAMACGDALGVPSSFLTPEQIKSKYGWIDTFYPPEKGHIFHDGLLAGEYTDDTEPVHGTDERLHPRQEGRAR